MGPCHARRVSRRPDPGPVIVPAIDDLAKRQLADYDLRRPGTVFENGPLALTVTHAYQVQIQVAAGRSGGRIQGRLSRRGRAPADEPGPAGVRSRFRHWSQRTDLIGDPVNVEWTDFSGKLSTGLKLDWSHPPARMCFNAPKIQAVTRRARDVIGAEIVSQLAILRAQGKENLFAGVMAGWESHMGQDMTTEDLVGFHALANRGFGPGKPPSDVGAEVASIVADFIGLWTAGLAEAGIDPTRIYTHVAFMNRTQFAQFVAAGQVPPNLTYEQLVNASPSSQHPSVAFAANSRPGFTTYPTPGIFAQIQEELSLHSNPGWASAEGTNLLPPGPAGNSNMTMETYLARCFNHGATLVTIFSWGLGGPSAMGAAAFRTVTQGPEALAAYRKFHSQ